LLQDSLGAPSGVTPGLMGIMFLPMPLTALVLFLWPVKKPHLSMSAVFFVLAILFFARLSTGLTLFLIICLGTWFSISVNSSMEFMDNLKVRHANTVMIVSVIAAQLFGAVAVALNLKLLPVLGVGAMAGGVVTFLMGGSSAPREIKPGGLRAIPKAQLTQAAPLMLVYLTAGVAEAVTMKRISTGGFGAETYACLMFGHSLASVFGAFATLTGKNWNKTIPLWLGAIGLIILGNITIVACGYAMLGALGILMAKEFRINIITSSENVAVFSAFSSFVLALCSALGAISGAYLV
jgi:hypothetical protein